MTKNKNLTDIIYQYKNKSIEWGKLDCCIFTAKVVEEYTGKKLPLWREMINYTNFKDALQILKSNGINSIEDLPTAILGTPKKPINEVKLGEPVFFYNKDGEGALGICNGTRAYFIREDKGLRTCSIEQCKYCWSIEDD